MVEFKEVLVMEWIFILIDTKKQIRGIYDGTDENEILRLIKDIKILKRFI